ncbi:MAG: V-type ATP synthase subunit D [Candidatus Anstonellales archaeon]
MSSDIQYTRMELLRLKNRLILARKGYSLLKRKLDVLISHLFELIKKFKEKQAEVDRLIKNSKNIAKVVSEEYTYAELEAIAKYNAIDYSMDISYRNVMGVRIPKITLNRNDRAPYYPFLKSVSLGALVMQNRELINILIDLTEITASLKYILKEIKKTKRRVNSLQYVIIPKIERDIELIRQKLEEMERENFVKLKSLKKDEI